jgi:two-component system LytT family sensor kinase
MNLDIRDTVDLTILQRIQDTFAEAMCVASMIVDRSGNPVTRPSNFVPICQMIRSTGAGFKRCMGCDAEGGQRARDLNRPHTYVCKGGLTDMAAPITIEGEYLGSVHFGQVIPLASREEFVEEIIRQNSSLGFPKDEVRQAAEAVPAVPRERIAAAAELLFLLANYIVAVGIANLTQAKLLEEVHSKAALHLELKDAQLRMLESQINPHFLFNTLALIGYKAIEEHAPQTGEIAYCLSDLLRYTLRNVSKPVTLGKELEIIERYLAIQQVRYESRLLVQMEIDPWLYPVRIPCMILQPLVENAVIHAVEPLARPVTVKIRVVPVPSGLMIEVVDDGPGMEPEVVAAINSRRFVERTGRTTIGLQNVIRRLELEYKSEFFFRIESQSGHGARVMLILPVFNVSATLNTQEVKHAWSRNR